MIMMSNPYRSLEKNIGYRFRRRTHLEMALTHPSYRYEEIGIDIDNQRLEFLGDAVLGLVAGAYLYDHFPECREGDMTQMRSVITNSKILSRIAQAVNMGAYLRLGRGEKQSGGDHRLSNLSDAMEAVIGAAYLDGGLKAVQKIFAKWFIPEIKPAADEQTTHNAKGALQEVTQRLWKCSPRYRTVQEEGPAHSKLFTVEVFINGNVMGSGKGTNKRDAEMEAARVALHSLEDSPD